jgi:hypothetical protein
VLAGADPYNDAKAAAANAWWAANAAQGGSGYTLPGVDGVDLWPVLSGELPPGASPHSQPLPLSTNALLDPSTGLKLITGNQNPAGWAAALYPNSTSSEGDTGFAADCSAGCLFNVTADPGEHHDLSAAMPDERDAMLAQLAQLALGFFQNGDVGVDSCPADFNNVPGCDACGEGAFPVNLTDTQCFGLQHLTSVASEEACFAACCGDPTCNVWQWCGGGEGAACTGPSCWAGAATLSDCSTTSAHAAGWKGGGSTEPPCTNDDVVPCACWMGANKWGGFFGPYQDIEV